MGFCQFRAHLGKAYPENKVHSVASLLVVLSVPSRTLSQPHRLAATHWKKISTHYDREHIKIMLNVLNSASDMHAIWTCALKWSGTLFFHITFNIPSWILFFLCRHISCAVYIDILDIFMPGTLLSVTFIVCCLEEKESSPRQRISSSWRHWRPNRPNLPWHLEMCRDTPWGIELSEISLPATSVSCHIFLCKFQFVHISITSAHWGMEEVGLPKATPHQLLYTTHSYSPAPSSFSSTPNTTNHTHPPTECRVWRSF